MKKFEYAMLEERVKYSSWLWLLDNDIVNPVDRVFLGETIYEPLSLIQVLNLLGADGWQAVNIKYNSVNSSNTILLMREVL